MLQLLAVSPQTSYQSCAPEPHCVTSVPQNRYFQLPQQKLIKSSADL